MLCKSDEAIKKTTLDVIFKEELCNKKSGPKYFKCQGALTVKGRI